ncbi:MAG: OsmC family protein [candidate division WOR-3 bacterium]|nr:OsmC family protein [candidate division WOR-3 bacterium]
MSTVKNIKITGQLKDNFIVETNMRKHTVIVDQPENGGGSDRGPTPLEYFFVSLAGCIGAIAKIKARQEKINLRSLEISVSGDIDTDVLMGKSDSNRPGFMNIIVNIDMDCDLNDEEKKAFIEDVDRRCPISDNISNATPVVFNVN